MGKVILLRSLERIFLPTLTCPDIFAHSCLQSEVAHRDEKLLAKQQEATYLQKQLSLAGVQAKDLQKQVGGCNGGCNRNVAAPLTHCRFISFSPCTLHCLYIPRCLCRLEVPHQARTAPRLRHTFCCGWPIMLLWLCTDFGALNSEGIS